MANTITANDIKTKGISAFKDIIDNENELFISVRGKEKFVALSIEKYNYFRECELEIALMQAKADFKNGNFKDYSIDEHLAKIANE